MKSTIIYLFILITLFSKVSNAQNLNPSGKIRCYSDEFLQQLALTDPAQKAAIDNELNKISIDAQHLSLPKSGSPVVTIPVVFHIVYNTAAQMVTTAQCMTQLSRLNLDFRLLNADSASIRSIFLGDKADAQIEFCLAVRDPNNQPTTGIIYKQTTATSFSTNDNVKHNNTNGDDIWDRNKYLNIWVCNLSNGTLGYAQFPGGAAATDGVVITWDAFGDGGSAVAPYNKGRTATHEIGHWLGLLHTFQGGCTGMTVNTCSTAGDKCCDTPPVTAANFGCPAATTNTCAESYSGNRPDMWENYMDYTDDACMYMFSNNQKSIMLATINGNRASLLTSNGCTPLGPMPTSSFTSSNDTICVGQSITYTNTSTGNPTLFSWNFGAGATPTVATTVGPHTISYSTTGNKTITLTASNANGGTPIQNTIVVIASPSGIINGLLTTCTNSNVTYSVPGLGNTYTWSVVGGNIIAGQGTNSISVNWGLGTTGSVNLIQTNTNNCTTNSSINITLINAISPAISGLTTVCSNGIQSYSCSAIIGASYLWSITGGTITSGQGTTTVGVNWGNGTTGTLSETTTLSASCSGTDTKNITINTVSTPVISGENQVCTGLIGNYSTAIINGATYQWNFTGAGQIQGGQGTNNFAVTWQSGTVATVTVTVTNNGCSATSLPFSITINNPIASFNFSINQNVVTFTNNSNNATAYSWNYGDGSALNNTTNPIYTYNTIGLFNVCLTASSGQCSNNTCKNVDIASLGNTNLINNIAGISVFPNPFSDYIYISSLNKSVKIMKVELIDLLGKKVNEEFNPLNNTITTNALTAGIYFIKITTNLQTLNVKLIKD
jgi:PKD repeat protein